MKAESDHEELTAVSPVMLHWSNVVSSTTISPRKGLKEGAVLQPTAETRHTGFHIRTSTSVLFRLFLKQNKQNL